MGHVEITFRADHSETERTPLDDAVAGLTSALRTRGYVGTLDVEWSGEMRTQSLNRDGTGGALLESPRAEVGQSRDVGGGQDGFTSDSSKDYSYQSKGGGYYDILVDGDVVDTVRGREAAEAWKA